MHVEAFNNSKSRSRHGCDGDLMVRSGHLTTPAPATNAALHVPEMARADAARLTKQTIKPDSENVKRNGYHRVVSRVADPICELGGVGSHVRCQRDWLTPVGAIVTVAKMTNLACNGGGSRVDRWANAWSTDEFDQCRNGELASINRCSVLRNCAATASVRFKRWKASRPPAMRNPNHVSKNSADRVGCAVSRAVEQPGGKALSCLSS